MRVGFRSGCLTRRRWDQLVASCSYPNLQPQPQPSPQPHPTPNTEPNLHFNPGQVAFCRDVGCQLVFTLNALHGRVRAACPQGTACRLTKPTPPCCTNYSGTWDARNAEAFLRRP